MSVDVHKTPFRQLRGSGEIVVMEDVSVSYANGVHALRNVSFTFRNGEHWLEPHRPHPRDPSAGVRNVAAQRPASDAVGLLIVIFNFESWQIGRASWSLHFESWPQVGTLPTVCVALYGLRSIPTA
jgi:hypothetical protein